MSKTDVSGLTQLGQPTAPLPASRARQTSSKPSRCCARHKFIGSVIASRSSDAAKKGLITS